MKSDSDTVKYLHRRQNWILEGKLFFNDLMLGHNRVRSRSFHFLLPKPSVTLPHLNPQIWLYMVMETLPIDVKSRILGRHSTLPFRKG